MKYFNFNTLRDTNFQKIYLFVLALTATICSRTMLAFIDDTEGPNLLVVFAIAFVIYFLSLATYIFSPLSSIKTDIKISVVIVLIQILFTGVLYFSLL